MIGLSSRPRAPTRGSRAPGSTVAKLEIFKAGLQTASNGEEIAFSAADIAAIASGYDPALHEAPAVVGHPSDDAPAYAWIKSLTAEGEKLFAELDQVDPAFAEMVNAGRFKHKSVALYRPADKGNPKPGTWYLRHLGFLGAAAPAVKGLKPAHFASPNERFVAFGEIPDAAIVRILRRLRDWMIATAGLATADEVLDADDLDWLGDRAAQPDPASASVTYREQRDMATPTAAELEARARDLDARETKLRTGEATLATTSAQ